MLLQFTCPLLSETLKQGKQNTETKFTQMCIDNISIGKYLKGSHNSLTHSVSDASRGPAKKG